MILSSFRIQKRCRKLFRLLFILGFIFSPVFSAKQTTKAQTFEEDLTAAAKTMFLKEDPTLDPSLVFVSDLLFDPPWGFGIVGTLANDFSEEPSITTFL